MNERTMETIIIGLLMIVLVGLALLCGYHVRGAVDKAVCSKDNIVIIHKGGK